MNDVLFQNFQSDKQFDLLKNEGLYQEPVLCEFAFIFIFVTPQKIYFFVNALISIEKLVSVDDALAASLREGK